ncbi:MAG: hypothetical protein OHK93_005961 [Ramalina farinacea]|uniref:Uncharacterized protein n=1 Tax=Ramalina farinacea TaxID=258253 RepID=A0AA43QKP7_9LECA|nr:hypothetical protein [Ramalina farinacea]
MRAFTQGLEGELERLGGVIDDAGISIHEFEMAEDNESIITVNVISTFILALLLRPILRASAPSHQTTPRISLVTSAVPTRHNSVPLSLQ